MSAHHLSAFFLFSLLSLTSPDVFGQEGSYLRAPHRGMLLQPTQRHGCAVVNGRLYVLGGGTPEGWSVVVRSAPFDGEGALGEWRNETVLPEPRTYIAASTVGVENRIYLVGGNTSNRPKAPDSELRKTRDVLWTQVGPDGRLGAWRRSAPFPGPALSCVGAASDGNYLVATGGSNDTDISNTVHVGRFGASGEIEEWRSSLPLPTPVWFHGTVIHGGRIFVWGGLTRRDRSYVNKRVFSAPFEGGEVRENWRLEQEMPSAVYGSAFTGGGDLLLAIGGRYSNEYPTNVVWAGSISSSGAATFWNLHKTDLEAWVNHAAAFDPATGIVFVTGGCEQKTPLATGGRILNAVQAFRLF